MYVNREQVAEMIKNKALPDDWRCELINTLYRMAAFDATPIKCGDCENYEPHIDYQTGKQFNFGYCYHWDYEQGSSPNIVDDDDFCSHGVKRNGEVKK